MSGRLPLHLVPGLTVHPPQAVVKADGSPYTVFTPFSRAWKSLPLPGPARTESLPRLASPPEVASLPLPDAAAPEGFPPGEEEAQRRLRQFTEGDGAPIYDYSESRNRLDQEGTSGLSPYLRFGMLSSRRALSAARLAANEAPGAAGRKGAETWTNELIWREFYIQVLAHFPHVLRRSFRSGLRHIRWSNDGQAFAAWCEGRTGYPVVDAAMRQLALTGWMHNRARMIVASFLTKDLLIDWRWGEQWFMDHLVDGDPAANNGGWQWTAGMGTDAAPYFRVFNPVLQGKRYDPEGAYTRRWVTELARVPQRYMHEPWLMPVDVQRDSGCVIGKDYPPPLVDHSQMRDRALTAYRASLGVKE